MTPALSLIKRRISSIGTAILDTTEAFSYAPKLWHRRDFFAKEIVNSGLKTFFVISIVSFFTGMILCLQTGLQLAVLGQQEFVGFVVAKSMFTEMGPFMTSLIIAASIGASYTSEIASMNVSEELAALRIMGINSNDFVIMPKLFALMCVAPVLTIYSNTLGSIGGMIIAYTKLNVGFEIYIDSVINSIKSKDIFVGLLKSEVFALIIITISNAKGLKASLGSSGISKATRQGVIISFLMILITGYFISSVFYS